MFETVLTSPSLAFIICMLVLYIACAGPILGVMMLAPFATKAEQDDMFVGSHKWLRHHHKKLSELWLLLAFLAVWLQTDSWRVMAPVLQTQLLVLAGLFILQHGLLLLWRAGAGAEPQSQKPIALAMPFVLAFLAFVNACLQGLLLASFLGFEHIAATPTFIVTLLACFLTPPTIFMLLALIRLPSSPFNDKVLLGMVIMLFAMIGVKSFIPILHPQTLWYQLPIGVFLILIPLSLVITALALLSSLHAWLSVPRRKTLLSPLTLIYGFIVLVVVAYIVTLRTLHIDGLMATEITDSLCRLAGLAGVCRLARLVASIHCHQQTRGRSNLVA